MGNPQLAYAEKFYQALEKHVSKFYKEFTKSAMIPLIQTVKFGVPEYKYPVFGASIGVENSDSLSSRIDPMETPADKATIKLEWTKANTIVKTEDRFTSEESTLQQKKQAELVEWAWRVDYANWKGRITKAGTKLNKGLLVQTKIIQNLNGTDSQLNAAGDWFKAAEGMFYSIPLQHRERFPIAFAMTENFWKKGNEDLFTYSDSGITEREQFMRFHMDPNRPKTDQINFMEVIDTGLQALATDTVTTQTSATAAGVQLADATAAVGVGAADTGGGTDDRILAMVLNRDYAGRVTSTGFKFFGEEIDKYKNLEQAFGYRGGVAVKRPEAVLYSEKITY